MPQTIRLEFAKSNTKVSKPKQPAAAAATTSHPALMHPLTGRKYAPPLNHTRCYYHHSSHPCIPTPSHQTKNPFLFTSTNPAAHTRLWCHVFVFFFFFFFIPLSYYRCSRCIVYTRILFIVSFNRQRSLSLYCYYCYLLYENLMFGHIETGHTTCWILFSLASLTEYVQHFIQFAVG